MKWYKHTMSRRVAAPLPAPDTDSSLLRGSLNRLGYTLADLPDKNTLWTHNIHLCVMFNHNHEGGKPNERVTNLLISYYFPFSKKITPILDGQPTQSPNWIPNYVKILLCDSNVGWYQHKCNRKCIQKYDTKTKGFLYISDDMFINITKMAAFPKK